MSRSRFGDELNQLFDRLILDPWVRPAKQTHVTERRPGLMKHLIPAVFWLAVYLALVLVPLFALLYDPVPGGGFWWDVAVGLGFAALTMMAVQFVLTARFRRATAPYGIDVIYYLHRYLAVICVAFAIAHAALLVWDNPGYLRVFDPRTAPPHLFAGVLSLLALIAVVGSSLWRKPLRLGYDPWRVLHLFLAVAAVLLAAFHVDGVDYYISGPWKRSLWGMIGASWLGIAIYVRVVRPYRLRTRPYEVASVIRERGDAWTLSLAPRGHAGLRFEPGQFVWLTLRHSPFAMKEHPFSISSAPASDGHVEVTIKELGDFTRTIGTIEPGEIAYVDGPYGSFSIDRHGAASLVLIGGGIGLAPLLSMLRAMADRSDARPVLLITANSRWERVPFREVIESVTPRLQLTAVHVLEEPHPGWTGRSGLVTRELLSELLAPNPAEREYFVCGPPPMIDAVERALHEVGVPVGQVHSELFDLV